MKHVLIPEPGDIVDFHDSQRRWRNATNREVIEGVFLQQGRFVVTLRGMKGSTVSFYESANHAAPTFPHDFCTPVTETSSEQNRLDITVDAKTFREAVCGQQAQAQTALADAQTKMQQEAAEAQTERMKAEDAPDIEPGDVVHLIGDPACIPFSVGAIGLHPPSTQQEPYYFEATIHWTVREGNAVSVHNAAVPVAALVKHPAKANQNTPNGTQSAAAKADLYVLTKNQLLGLVSAWHGAATRSATDPDVVRPLHISMSFHCGDGEHAVTLDDEKWSLEGPFGQELAKASSNQSDAQDSKRFDKSDPRDLIKFTANDMLGAVKAGYYARCDMCGDNLLEQSHDVVWSVRGVKLHATRFGEDWTINAKKQGDAP